MRVPALAGSEQTVKAVCRVAAPWLMLAVSMAEALGQSSTKPTPRLGPQQFEQRIDAIDVERKRSRMPPPVTRRPAEPGPATSSVPLLALKTVAVEGVITFSAEEIAKEYRDYLGRKISQEDLQKITSAITELYRKAGFHLSRAIIPPQEVVGGNLRILVIEGAITELQFKGSTPEQYGLRSYFAPVLTENPSRLKTVERSLLLANDLPGVRITDAELEEIGEASGKFRLIVSAETWRIFGNVGVDNSGTYSVGPLQAYSSLNLNSGLVAGDTLGVNVSTVPDGFQDLRYGRVAYDTPIGRDGARLGASGSFGEVRPDDEQSLVNTVTRSQAFELRGSIIPLQSRERSLTLAAAFAFSEETGENVSGVTYKDRVRTVSFAADYKMHDQLDGWNYVTLGVKQGLDAFGSTPVDDPISSRARASPNFTAYSFAYSRYQPIFGPWSIRGQVLGQLASGPLLSSQAFFLGGAGFGPGYYSGDNGVAGLLELRFSQTVNAKFLQSFQFYGFVDAGSVWDDSYDERVSLASAGGGVRLEFEDEWRASLGFAIPISYSNKSDEFRSSRVLFSMSKSFKLCPSEAKMTCQK